MRTTLYRIASMITGLFIAATTAWAQGPVTVTECPRGFKAAAVDIAVNLQTAAGCPVLEEPRLSRLVFDNFSGATFAGAPGTCISGAISIPHYIADFARWNTERISGNLSQNRICALADIDGPCVKRQPPLAV